MTETQCALHPFALMGGAECPACARLVELKELLRARTPKDDDSPGCFLCKWILLDLEANAGKLKGWNMDAFEKPIFPKQAEVAHLKLEGIPFVESEL